MLSDQLRADRFAILHHHAAVRLMRKQALRDDRDQRRIRETGENGEQAEDRQCGT